MSGGFQAALRALRRVDEAREVVDGAEVHVRRDPIEHAVRNFRRGSAQRAAVVEFAALAGSQTSERNGFRESAELILCFKFRDTGEKFLGGL